MSREIILINDILTGCMGERVLWDFMLEGIPNIHRVDMHSLSCDRNSLEQKAKEYIDNNFDHDTIIIQNATFLGKIDNTRYTIAFLQDNLRAMNRTDWCQENVLRTSQKIVFNSNEIAKSYSEFNNIEVVPIGIDSDLFTVKSKKEMKMKYNLSHYSKIGIFVGDFSEVKGWTEVRHIIENYPDIFFILVTKNNEYYESCNSIVYRRIKQDLLSDLLSCADFFILGSPVETQCLAAQEAGFCNVPVIMKNTGIFMDMKEYERNRIGVFNDSIHAGLNEFLAAKDKSQFSPRETLFSCNLAIEDTIEKWNKLIKEI